MAKDPSNPEFTVGIVGAGTMGRGIAQIMAMGGLQVKLFDAGDGAAAEGRDFAARMIARAAEKGAITEAEAKSHSDNMVAVGALADLADADLVVEAIVEDLGIKQKVLAELEAIVAKECILATNTSSLSVTAIAATAQKPERFAGYHFFNPVPLLKVVEVVEGLRTERWVTEALVKVARRAGHEPVRTKDTPGFLVNHAGRGLYTEGLRIISEGIGDFAAVDDVMREGGAGFRMGPFELLDVTGLDVSHVVMESIYHQFYEEPRFRPQPLTRQRMIGGVLGRKSGGGFYAYDADGKKKTPPAKKITADLPASVWIGDAGTDEANALAAALKGKVEIETGAKPSAAAICLFAPLGCDATSCAVAAKVEAERCFAIDAMFGLDGRRTLMTTPVSDPDLRDQVHALLAADDHAVTVIHDSAGFVAQRMIATIVNIASEIAQARIATPEDIDKAVRLGLAYPQGPLAMGDKWRPRKILTVLENMQAFYGDPRYRPSPWLRRRAMLGVSLLTPEG
jgi:3-hydroxybutyryl-CoA dehydrogenase